MATLEIDSAVFWDPTTTYRSKSSLISDWLPIIFGGELSFVWPACMASGHCNLTAWHDAAWIQN